MNVKDIIIESLRAMGAEGLCISPGVEYCGCGIDDIAPCGRPHSGCAAARKHSFNPASQTCKDCQGLGDDICQSEDILCRDGTREKIGHCYWPLEDLP
jgi:hypothetical protein